MAAKVTLTTIAGGYGSVAAINANFTALADAIDLLLSRDGEVPNEMLDNLDMNGHLILNCPSFTALGADDLLSGTVNNLVVNNTLVVNGDSFLTGVTVSGNLSVDGTTTLNNLVVEGTTTLCGDISFCDGALPDGFVRTTHLSEEVLNLIFSGGADGSGSASIASGNGRLTLVSDTPVMTSDVTGKTTVFYAGSVVLILNDGTGNFAPQPISELQQALSSVARSPAASAANKLYDMFGWQGASQSVTSITRSGSTATVTKTAHGYNTGECVVIAGAAQAEYNGAHSITVVDANSFTFTVSGTPATPATGTITMMGIFLSRGPAWRNGGQVITGATNATPIVITANGHGLSTGDDAEVSNVLGNTAANGRWTVTVVDANTFSLNGSVGNGAYTAGTGSFASRGAGVGSSAIELLGNTYVNKVAIVNGPAAQMGTYLGTIMTNAANQLDWKLGSLASGGGEAWLGVWNVSNRVEVGTAVQDSTASWTKATNTTEALNTSNTWRVTRVCGLNDSILKAVILSQVFPPSTGSAAGVAVGLDSTSLPAPRANVVSAANGNVNTAANFPITSEWNGFVGLGKHFIQALQIASLNGGSATLYGTSAEGLNQSTMYTYSQQ